LELAENRILEILTKKGRLRHADLQRIVVDKEKICAKKTFDKALQQLCLSCKIIRNEESKQHVWYEIPNFLKKQSNVNQFFEFQLNNVTKYFNLFLKKESKLNDEQKAVFIIHLFDSIDYLEKMFLTLESISDLKQSKVIKPVVLTSLKEFSDKVYSTCSKSLSDPMVSQHVMSLIGKRYSTSLTNIHKILD
jgi:hypothetical protein